MKKAVCLFCALSFLISLSACSSSNADPSPPDALTASETPSATASDGTVKSNNPFLAADFSTGPVLSGSGKNIGTYGYIMAEKSALPDFSTKEFSDYFTEFANERVRDSGYNWVSIIFDDGTGFCFTGSNTIIADYGTIDDEGCITTQLGMCIVSSSGSFEYEEIRTRSIPNPTLMQEALAPSNSFEPVSAEIFSSTAEENGLEDIAYYAEGTVVSRFDEKGYDTIQIATKDGDLYVSALLVELPEISEGDYITVFFVYSGWSDVIGGACGAYVYSE